MNSWLSTTLAALAHANPRGDRDASRPAASDHEPLVTLAAVDFDDDDVPTARVGPGWSPAEPDEPTDPMMLAPWLVAADEEPRPRA